MAKILITGAGGFIGSHLTERCVELGYDVKAFVRYNSKNSRGWLEKSRLKKDIEIVSGDIRDYDSVHDAMVGCNTVFHLAALIGIPYSYVSPLAYVRTNVEGTYNVLQSALERNLHQVLITSTSETYGTARYVPIDEDHPPAGQSPYSASKIGADQLAMSYFRSFALPVKIVRPFNTYGPRQSARAVIPTIIMQILEGAKKVKLGNVHPTRDLTFVKDTVEGFIEIFKTKDLTGESTNIGTNEEISIGSLAKLIAGIMNVRVDLVTEKKRVRPKSSEVGRLMCKNTKILTRTGWHPHYTVKQGLTETVDWFRENIGLYKSGIYTI